MVSRNYREILGGVLLMGFGLAFATYGWSHYSLGSLGRMGPAMFPVASGLLLVVLGMLQAIWGWLHRAERADIRLRPLVFVVLGIASFALLIGTMGLLPSVISVVVISSFAEDTPRPLALLVLASVLCLIAWLIFIVALGLSVPLVAFPV